MAKVYTQYLMAMAGLLALTACRNDATTFVPTNTDKFVFYSEDYYEQAAQLLQADYLIVQDMSYSMNVSQESVREALSEFSGYLSSSDIDFRIGLVRGTNQSQANSQSNATWENTIPSNFLGGILTPSSISGLLGQVASALPGNSPNEVVILEAAKRTLAAQGSSFLRDAAQLVYVFISDTDDESRTLLGGTFRTPQKYAESLLGVKKHSTYVNARAFVYANNGSCNVPDSYRKPGEILADVAGRINSSGPSRRCLSSYNSMAQSLEDMARNVSKPTTRFALRATPVPSSIAISVDNAPFTTDSEDNSWSYNSATNEIVFMTGQEPEATKPLEIQYDMVMKLSRLPRVDSMIVTVNGVNVPSTAISVNSSTLELTISAPYAPAHNANVLVNYMVK